MRWIVESSLKFRLLVAVVAAGVLFLSVTQLRNAPVDTLPEFTPPYVEVQTEALGLSAAEVEELITVPLEGDLLNGVAGIDVIRSESVAGLSSILMVFTPGTDLLDARQLVQERLVQAHALPNVSKPPAMLQPLSSASRVLMVGLTSEELSLTEMGLLARWTIRPRLLGVPGVANVAIWGQREHQLQVQVDPERLRARGVSLNQIISTTGNAQLVSPLSFLEASTPGTGGFIDTPNQRLQIRHILPIATPAGLAQVPVDGIEGKRVRLGDVTHIVEDHQPLIGDAVVNDGPGLLLVVEKFAGANTLEVTRDVEDALDALRPGLAGIEIDSSIFRPASSIERAIDSLALVLAIAAVLLMLVIRAAFLEWRAAGIVLVAVALSLGAAGTVLILLGETMNAMVLAGLVLGATIVIDDAIISVENVSRRLRERGRRAGDDFAAVLIRDSSLEVRRPLVYGTLIVLVMAVPVLVLGGRAGDFFGPLALSYALAATTSMVVALTATPALCFLLLSRGPVERRNPLVVWSKVGYERAFSKVVDRPIWAVATAGAVLLIAGLLIPQLDRGLIPSFKQRELVVNLEAAAGTSRPEMVRITTQLSRELRAVSVVENVGVHLGRAVMADRVVGINSGSLWVTLRSSADYEEAVAAVRSVVGGYPGIQEEVLTHSDEVVRAVAAVDDRETGAPVSEGVLDVLTGADEPVVVRIYGQDLDVLRTKGEEVRRVLAGVDGIVQARLDSGAEEPTLQIEVDLAAARRHGVSPGDVRRAAAALVQGIEVGSLFEEQKVFEVVIVGEPGIRSSLASLGELLIDTPGGGQVRLADVASIRMTPTPVTIEREAASRRIDVVADVRGRDLGAVLDDVEQRLGGVEFPLEYHAELVGGSSERDASQRRLLASGIAAAVAAFLLLQAAFGSWRLAAVFALALPLALTGGVLAVFATGADLSLGSIAGFAAVFGLAARNVILLVGRYRGLEEEGERPGLELVLRATKERLPALLTSAAALAVAFTPFLVMGDVAGLEIVQPLAVVLLGGLTTSTLVTLFLVPLLYLQFAATGERRPLEVAIEHPAGSLSD